MAVDLSSYSTIATSCGMNWMILPPGVIEVVLATSVVTIESVKAPARRIMEPF